MLLASPLLLFRFSIDIPLSILDSPWLRRVLRAVRLFLTINKVHLYLLILSKSPAYCQSLRMWTNQDSTSQTSSIRLPSMSSAAPVVPPRPARVQQAAHAQGADHLPEIPPRPIPKRLDRSVSPSNYPRSPLNEPYTPLGRMRSRDSKPEEGSLQKRPSVQHLPSVGQEGLEYADLQYQPLLPASALGADAAAQTRNVAEDLHLHAPKPSLPKSSATAQVQAVTRTDSSSAAQHGIGNATPVGQDQHTEPLGRIRSRASFSRPGSSSSQQHGRRSSMAQDEDHGPAELGMRVPINPLLGDVQAPSPAPQTPSHTGQNGEKRRLHHARTKSGRDTLPPGSYGLHGHGVPSSDPFEQDWYAKHPEQLVSEEAHGHGVYEGIGSGRGAFAMSSDDLNQIVRDTASRGGGFGKSLDVDQEYLVDEYRHHGQNYFLPRRADRVHGVGTICLEIPIYCST